MTKGKKKERDLASALYISEEVADKSMGLLAAMSKFDGASQAGYMCALITTWIRGIEPEGRLTVMEFMFDSVENLLKEI